ncbi:MAG: hypothetical protein E7323_06550 [Clostridiales bacterium]|nr:hypothetical protein [Clostridiales bacterium]
MWQVLNALPYNGFNNFLSFFEIFLSKNDKKLLTSDMARDIIPTVEAQDTFRRGWPPGGKPNLLQPHYHRHPTPHSLPGIRQSPST